MDSDGFEVSAMRFVRGEEIPQVNWLPVRPNARDELAINFAHANRKPPLRVRPVPGVFGWSAGAEVYPSVVQRVAVNVVRLFALLWLYDDASKGNGALRAVLGTLNGDVTIAGADAAMPWLIQQVGVLWRHQRDKPIPNWSENMIATIARAPRAARPIHLCIVDGHARSPARMLVRTGVLR